MSCHAQLNSEASVSNHRPHPYTYDESIPPTGAQPSPMTSPGSPRKGCISGGGNEQAYSIGPFVCRGTFRMSQDAMTNPGLSYSFRKRINWKRKKILESTAESNTLRTLKQMRIQKDKGIQGKSQRKAGRLHCSLGSSLHSLSNA